MMLFLKTIGVHRTPLIFIKFIYQLGITIILEKYCHVHRGQPTNSHTEKSSSLGIWQHLSPWDPTRQKELLATTTKMVKEFLNSHKNGQPYHTFTSL